MVEPGGLPDPLQLEPGVGPHPDGRGLGSPDGLLDGFVQLLRVEDEHVHGFLVLLGVHVLAHHGGFDRGKDTELGAQGGDLLTNLKKSFLSEQDRLSEIETLANCSKGRILMYSMEQKIMSFFFYFKILRKFLSKRAAIFSVDWLNIELIDVHLEDYISELDRCNACFIGKGKNLLSVFCAFKFEKKSVQSLNICLHVYKHQIAVFNSDKSKKITLINDNYNS